MRIDLHTHSSVSDGTDTPEQLVQAAKDSGLDVVAITDHDTTAGWESAAQALPAGLNLVRGMEMSCEGRGEDGRPVPVHLLAYLFDPQQSGFAAERRRLRGERTSRIRAMAERMAADGLPIDVEALTAAAGPSLGRPHLARALIDAGIVASVDEAFRGPLATRSPYYVPKKDTPLEDAVRLVTEAGGVAVVAHPRARARGRLLDLDHVRELVPLGLGGLEVDHYDHTTEDAVILRRLAAELGLAITGSSDYHGINKSVRMGAFTTAPDQFDALVARTSGVPLVTR